MLSVQDLGRFNAQHLGFSASGVADEHAFLSGNQILKNDKNSPALEVTFGQLTFTVNCECNIVITGADCSTKINKTPIKHWQMQTLYKGDIVELLVPRSGIYSYICIAGGIQANSFLMSTCSIPNALQEQICNQEDNNILTYFLSKQPKEQNNSEENKIDNNQLIGINNQPHNYYFKSTKLSVHTIRFIPHQFWFELTEQAQFKILNQDYKIQSNSNKMGYRLKGESPIKSYVGNLLSKPVTLGAIQIPSDGQPIILMKDRQTIGGYPTLGNVIQVDLPRLAQLNAHQKIQLLPTTIEHAQAQLSAFYARLTNS